MQAWLLGSLLRGNTAFIYLYNENHIGLLLLQ